MKILKTKKKNTKAVNCNLETLNLLITNSMFFLPSDCVDV